MPARKRKNSDVVAGLRMAERFLASHSKEIAEGEGALSGYALESQRQWRWAIDDALVRLSHHRKDVEAVSAVRVRDRAKVQ